jgi:sulfur carrier protein ThiS
VWSIPKEGPLPEVRFTRHLRLHFPDLADAQVPGRTLAEVLEALDQRHPGLRSYLVDDRGALRTHVNLFINEELLKDRAKLTDPVAETDRVFVLQALSGG